MITLIGMPQGAEWLVILAIVVLLFGSAKLPTLVRQLGKSKKIWEEEVGPGAKKKPEGELTQGVHIPEQTVYPQTPAQTPGQPVQPLPTQPVQTHPGQTYPGQAYPGQPVQPGQPPVQQPPIQGQQPGQVNGQAPGEGLPPSRSAN